MTWASTAFSTTKQAEDDQDDRDDDQHMDEIAQSDSGEQTQKPENNQYDGNGEEHGRLPWMTG